jgi:hypothetical protein
MIIQDILNEFGDSARVFTSYLNDNDIDPDQFNSASVKLRCQAINQFLGYPELKYITDDIAVKEIFHKFTLYRDAFEKYNPSDKDPIKVLAAMEVEERNRKYPGMWTIVKMNIKDCLRGLSTVRLSIKDCVVQASTDALSIKDCVIARIDPDLEYLKLKQIEQEILNKFWFMSIERTWNPIEVPF